ncbi:MAG: DsbA family protein [Bifidobacteriaceae bacterium]|jgi:protein-disulfide isomerase|nr:DsbA family protein [Bifidobacteriaceae bacterium]
MISLPGVRVGAGGVAIGVLGDQDRPPTQIDVFVDYMCPFCRHFERDNGADVQELVDRGVASLIMHPIAILDRLSAGTMYSTRAAAAAYAVAAGAPAEFGAFNAALFRDQPREGGPGLSQAELAAIAQGVGIKRKVALTFADDQFMREAGEATRAAIEAGVQGTPTVLLSGHHQGAHLWDGSRPISESLLSLAAR